MIACEKPLAMNVAEAEEITAAVEKAGVPNMVWFNYRRVPAIALAKEAIGADDALVLLGDVYVSTTLAERMASARGIALSLAEEEKLITAGA